MIEDPSKMTHHSASKVPTAAKASVCGVDTTILANKLMIKDNDFIFMIKSEILLLVHIFLVIYVSTY